MVTKYPDRMQVTHWTAVFDCGHQVTLTDAEIHKPTETRAGGQHGTGVDMYFCSKCAKGDKTSYGDHGFCTQSVLHSITMASPLLSRRKVQAAQLQQEQGEQKEEEVSATLDRYILLEE